MNKTLVLERPEGE